MPLSLWLAAANSWFIVLLSETLTEQYLTAPCLTVAFVIFEKTVAISAKTPKISRRRLVLGLFQTILGENY